MRAAHLIGFLLTLDRLKAVERRTKPSGLSRFENSAEHSWHAALSALMLEHECAFTVDAKHAALMLLMHDVPEILCGDTFLYAAARDEACANEARALTELLAPLTMPSADAAHALWHEFTAGETPTARYANAIDRLLPVLHNIAHRGETWRIHSITLPQVMQRTRDVQASLPGIWAVVQPQVEAVFAEIAV